MLQLSKMQLIRISYRLVEKMLVFSVLVSYYSTCFVQLGWGGRYPLALYYWKAGLSLVRQDSHPTSHNLGQSGFSSSHPLDSSWMLLGLGRNFLLLFCLTFS